MTKVQGPLTRTQRIEFRKDGTMTKYPGPPDGHCGTVPAHYYEGEKGTWQLTSDSILTITIKESKGAAIDHWQIIRLDADTLTSKVKDSKDIYFPINEKSNYDLYDSAFTSVHLKDDVSDKKVVVVKAGQRAIIYLKAKLLIQWALENTNDFNRAELSPIVARLQSIPPQRDTISIDLNWDNFDYWNDFDYFDFMVSEQLKSGNAKVFYNKTKSFVSTITYRLEKYDREGYRFFYLPDGRPFYRKSEFLVLIENYKYLPMGYGMPDLRVKVASMKNE